MKVEWKHLSRGRLVADLGGSFVVKPVDTIVVPLGCNVCSALYRTMDDEASHREFECCHLCALRWAHPDRSRWNDGWRPDREDVEKDVERRTPLTFTYVGDVE